MRRVVVWDEEQKRELVFLTNHMGFAASTVAAIYKERWQIELFFKALKQNLTGEDFRGTTENAVQTQIWTALIAMLMLKFLQLKSHIAWSLSHLAAMLRMNLLTYRDLWAWLDAPFQVARLEPAEKQMELIPRDLDSILPKAGGLILGNVRTCPKSLVSGWPQGSNSVILDSSGNI